MQACPVNDDISYLLKSKYKQKYQKLIFTGFLISILHIYQILTHFWLEEKEIQRLHIFSHYCPVTCAVARTLLKHNVFYWHYIQLPKIKVKFELVSVVTNTWKVIPGTEMWNMEWKNLLWYCGNQHKGGLQQWVFNPQSNHFTIIQLACTCEPVKSANYTELRFYNLT